MITGDHKDTAEAIAREVGISTKDSEAVTGAALDEMDDREVATTLDTVRVFARASPKHKIRIVKALKRTGHIVAMTGDGTNDAPAVREADIGVAMGLSGTDVTREASAMVLADDNFATIVSAVEEGRGIYDNIRKFIRYLLSCNVGEVLIMFLAAIFGEPVPLVPIQMLWINLVTDGLPAIALGIDPPARDIMGRPPRDPRESVFSRGLSLRIIERGILIGLGSFSMFVAALEGSGSVERARTVAFATLILFQLFHVFDCRTERGTVFDVGFFANRALVLAVLCSLLMTVPVIYVSGLARYFHTVALFAGDWALIFLVTGMTTIFHGLLHVLKKK